MKKTYATKQAQLVVECKQHSGDEGYYREYVDSDAIADAWIALHNLQHHGVAS